MLVVNIKIGITLLLILWAAPLQAKIKQTEIQQTYNITVAGNYNYFAGHLETLVHNCGKNDLLNKYPGPKLSADGKVITTKDGKIFYNDGKGDVLLPIRKTYD